ncbi:MAG: hypothetical protein IKU34_12265 [Clostridia bacterium]|nr:hypothetical protein [Clostridia bacterium]
MTNDRAREIIEQLRLSDKLNYAPTDVAELLECRPYAINAHLDAGDTYPFECFRINRRVKIPRGEFLRWAEAKYLL